MEIWIRTLETKDAKNRSFEEGYQKTTETLEMPVDVVNARKLGSFATDKKEKSEKLENLLDETNQVIKAIADKLSNAVEDSGSLSEMEIEFSLGFTEKLNLMIFEVGSNQSIKVKMKLQKK